MNKKFFRRAAAFAVALLMAGGMINVLPDEYFPHIGAVVSAEGTDGVAVDSINFPDGIFRQYISDNFDSDNNGVLSEQEINEVKTINVEKSGIQSCKGVEFFPQLSYFVCNDNQLTSLDVSNNIVLNCLICNNNQLTSLDVSNNTALVTLWCGENQLTSLDVSKNTALTELLCTENCLTSLDVRNSTALVTLWCSTNQLESLDVSNNVKLTGLLCENNHLTLLDVSNNTDLEYMNCGNQYMYRNNNQLTSLDISNNIKLTSLYCDYNQLTSLDVSNNTELTILYCGNNQLTSLDVSNNTALVTLWCGENQLTSLDVSNNTALTELVCYYNRLTSLDVSNNTAITRLSCYSNSYNIGETCGTYDLKNLPADFDITKASNWQEATLEDGKLTGIDSIGDITYDYDCGNNHTETFYLMYDYVDHIYDEGLVTIEPTEQTEGEKTYTCTICGATKTEVIAKLEHVHNQGTELMSDATGHWYTCSSCDEKLDFATHTEDNGTVTVEPTVTTEGQKVYKCTVCGYTTRTEVVAKLEQGNPNPSIPSQPSNPSQPSQTQQPEEEKEPETNISVKKGWGNVVKEINKANDNSKINVDMGNSSTVPKNVLNAVQGKDIDVVLDMGDGMTWTINGKDVTDPQSIDFSVTKKKNQIPEDMISDPSNTIPLVLAHNGSFGCSATLSIDLKDNDNKIANLYYYNTKTKELEFVDSSVIVNGKANLVFTHASDWAIVISDTSAAYEDVSSAAGAYETDDNSQAPLCIIVIILTALGFSYIIITKRLTKHKR